MERGLSYNNNNFLTGENINNKNLKIARMQMEKYNCRSIWGSCYLWDVGRHYNKQHSKNKPKKLII